ncbi:hypothetical protein [Streptomyces caniscabiei]|uniref:Uncharacterized protein n=1 Tax=Streptomyces caniscabiei TaxID=2746961 RepID=A0ABU4N166_9ACTN|nr:hypothetical protein [Streptomyces caniscabiei]MDX2946918.1 hypothetical protein [Streptomyces caniscabiei]MDX2955985.1 hypothetical protein [Streptomyces caniscabiei]MDX2989679.1 hypothetical protein [Streptomyces caniscabiei]MDX3013564.1 hypothetical protein [Streptomyces caniscabiei]MDX3043516.1 hypothetical protein [Streptomyces caniscabiei]
MSAPARPPLKSITPTTAAPRAAEPAPPQSAVGEPKGAARQGVSSAVCPRPQRGDGRYPVAWLHIVAPRGATPTATSKCLCGRDRSAVGHRRVLALIADHTAHRDTCPLRTPQEGRTAA